MSSLEVVVKHGRCRGVQVESILGKNYLVFEGIPYAAPPTGDYRFRDPQPVEPWTGIRESSKLKPCAQWVSQTEKIVGEDCLYLNVSTTSLEGSRPVMFWIHGGGFVMGNGGTDLYSPDYLMHTDIVFVSINYRLGVFGFLNVDHEVAPGNYGLKDQTAALKWVHENISQFGGDPNNVTIFGQSAGAVSVHYHLLSPLSRGLFHKAILQSGVAINPWASQSNQKDKVKRLLVALSSSATDPVRIIEFLRTIPSERIVEAVESMATSEERLIFCSPFVPTVDDKSPEPFLPRPVEELIEEGCADVPTIIGYNSTEGLATAAAMGEAEYAIINWNFETVMLRNLITKDVEKAAEITGKTRKFYFQEKQVCDETVNECGRFISDSQLVAGIHRTVEFLRVKKSPTYFYKLSYDNPKAIGKVMMNLKMKGTTHSDDLHYIFHPLLYDDAVNIEPNTTERLVLDRILTMWTDFAKTGDPTPEIDDVINEKWLPLTTLTKNYLEINENLIPGENPDEEIWQYWKSVFEMVHTEKKSLNRGFYVP